MAPPWSPQSTLTPQDKAVLAMSKSEYLDSLLHGSRHRQNQQHREGNTANDALLSPSSNVKRAAPDVLPPERTNILSLSSRDTRHRPFHQQLSGPPNMPLPPLPEERVAQEVQGNKTFGSGEVASSFFTPKIPEPPPSLPPLDMILSQITLAEEWRNDTENTVNHFSFDNDQTSNSTKKSNEAESSHQYPLHSNSGTAERQRAKHQKPGIGKRGRHRAIVDQLTVGVCIVQAEPCPAVLVTRRRRKQQQDNTGASDIAHRPAPSSRPSPPSWSSSSSSRPPTPPEKDDHWCTAPTRPRRKQQRQEPQDIWELPSGPVRGRDFCVSTAIARVVDSQLGLKVYKILGVLRPRLEWGRQSDSTDDEGHVVDCRGGREHDPSSEDEEDGNGRSSGDEDAELEGEMLIGATSLAHKVYQGAVEEKTRAEKNGKRKKKKNRILRLNYVVQVYEQDADYFDEPSERKRAESDESIDPGGRENDKSDQPRKWDQEESEEETMYDAVLWAEEKELIEDHRLQMSAETRRIVAEALRWAGGKWPDNEQDQEQNLSASLNRQDNSKIPRKVTGWQNHGQSMDRNGRNESLVHNGGLRPNTEKQKQPMKGDDEKGKESWRPSHMGPNPSVEFQSPRSNQAPNIAAPKLHSESYHPPEEHNKEPNTGNDSARVERRMTTNSTQTFFPPTRIPAPAAPLPPPLPRMMPYHIEGSAPSKPTATAPTARYEPREDGLQQHRSGLASPQEYEAASRQESQRRPQLHHPQPIRTSSAFGLPFYPSPSSTASPNFFSPPPLTLSPPVPTPPLRISNKPLATEPDAHSPTPPPLEIPIPAPMRLLPSKRSESIATSTAYPTPSHQHSQTRDETACDGPSVREEHGRHHHRSHVPRLHISRSDDNKQRIPSHNEPESAAQIQPPPPRQTNFQSSSPPPPLPSSPSPPPLPPTPAETATKEKTHHHHHGTMRDFIQAMKVVPPRRPLPPAGPAPRRGPPPKRPFRGPEVGLGHFTGTKTGSLGELVGGGLVAVIEDPVGEEREENLDSRNRNRNREREKEMGWGKGSDWGKL